MPRRARLVLADLPLHIIQRGNNRQPCFAAHADYLVYLDMLRICAETTNCAIHAYVLMTNHVHLLLSPPDSRAPGKLMKSLGERYVPYFNRRHGRTGTLWEGRFHSCLVDDSRYMLLCQRYIELNPVRANMVTHPAGYPWSSYRSNADGDNSVVITPHAMYASLGTDAAARQAAYRALFSVIPADTLNKVRRATIGNFALGDMTFASEVESALGCRAVAQKSGRPRND